MKLLEWILALMCGFAMSVFCEEYLILLKKKEEKV